MHINKNRDKLVANFIFWLYPKNEGEPEKFLFMGLGGLFKCQHKMDTL